MYARQVGWRRNSTALAARARGSSAQPGHLVDHHVGIGAVDVEAPGGVAPGPPRATSPASATAATVVGVVADAERPEVRGDERLGSPAEHRLETEVGQALGDQALRRTDQEDGLLQPAPAADEADLLAGVLGVVARVGLVGDEVGERGREHGQVDVDRHRASGDRRGSS